MQIAGQIEDLINVGVEVLHVRLDEDDVAALDPLVFGLVGCRLHPPPGAGCPCPRSKPDRAAFVELVTEAVWLQIAGMAKHRGVELEPDRAGRGCSWRGRGGGPSTGPPGEP